MKIRQKANNFITLVLISFSLVLLEGGSFSYRASLAGESGVISSTGVTTEWIRRYNGSGKALDYVRAVAVDNQGNAYVTGDSTGLGSYLDFVTIKYDTYGNQKWARPYNGSGNGDDNARAIAVDTQGNVYVSGHSAGISSRDYLTIKYDTNGKREWVRRYDGPEKFHDYVSGMAVDGQENVFVTGYYTDNHLPHTSTGWATIKYDTNGKLKWVRLYQGSGKGGFAKGIAVDSQGNVYVTGDSYEQDSRLDYMTIKYDTDGNQIWAKRYKNPISGATAQGWAITVDSAGNVYVTGNTVRVNQFVYSNDYTTIKYDTNGNQKWISAYNGPNNESDIPLSIALDDEGNVVVSGVTTNKPFGGQTQSTNCTTIKYDTNGKQKWVNHYPDTDSGYCQSGPNGLAIDNAGNVLTVGTYSPNIWDLDSPDEHFVVINYDTEGNRKWTRSKRNQSWGTAIAIDNAGNVFATGALGNDSDVRVYDELNYMTLKLSPQN